MRPYRSMLYVPGNKPSWMEKAAEYGADALILDLEDSVPDQEKIAARPLIKAAVKALKAKGQACYVRVNAFATGLTLGDLEGVMCCELDGINLPKVETTEDMQALHTLMTHLEKRMNIPAQSMETPLGLETAKGMRNIYEIATSCPRVRRMTLAAGPGGDAARAIGYVWSKEGRKPYSFAPRPFLIRVPRGSSTR
jgi:citrate lyase subunit beta/citryl-CoA lyase